MQTISFYLNGEKVSVDVEPDTPILWVIREKLGLMGTKYSCGKAICGSCTIHLDGKPVRSCVTDAIAFEGKSVTTIEGLSKDNSHPLQKAWIEAQVPQCGYCQSGQIMQAAALLKQNNKPSRDEIISYMKGNLCRCGTYTRILKAIENVAQNDSL